MRIHSAGSPGVYYIQDFKNHQQQQVAGEGKSEGPQNLQHHQQHINLCGPARTTSGVLTAGCNGLLCLYAWFAALLMDACCPASCLSAHLHACLLVIVVLQQAGADKQPPAHKARCYAAHGYEPVQQHIFFDPAACQLLLAMVLLHHAKAHAGSCCTAMPA
jgi:hypothetical protein